MWQVILTYINHKLNIELSRSLDLVLVRRFCPWTFFSHKTAVEWHDSRPIGDILEDQRDEHKESENEHGVLEMNTRSENENVNEDRMRVSIEEWKGKK